MSHAPGSRSAFTLIEAMIALSLGLVIVYTAFMGFRVASQTVTTANRLALENNLMRAGFIQALDSADYWSDFDNPDDPHNQALRQYDPTTHRGLPFTPLQVSWPGIPGAGSPGPNGFGQEADRGWDPAYQWPAADPRTWWQGNMAECCDSTQRRFGNYEVFAHVKSNANLNRAIGPGGVSYGTVTPTHTWLFNQMVGVKNALGYYGMMDYLPADEPFGVLGDAGADNVYGTSDDVDEKLADEWCQPSNGGPPFKMASPDGWTEMPRGTYRLTMFTSFGIFPENPDSKTDAEVGAWNANLLVQHHCEGDYGWAPSQLQGYLHGIELNLPVTPYEPADWPKVEVGVSHYVYYSRYVTLCQIALENVTTGKSTQINFSILGTSLRGARQQRKPHGGWAHWYGPLDPRNDPTLDSYGN